MISIHEDKHRPEDVLEEWIFNVIYSTEPRTGARVPSAVDVCENRQSEARVTVGQARGALIKFIKAVSDIAWVLPELPATKFMQVKMLYTNECPEDYHALGCTESTADIVTRFPSDEEWKAETRKVATMNAGHHEVSLSLIHLANQQSAESLRLPSGLDCTEEVPMEKRAHFSHLPNQPTLTTNNPTKCPSTAHQQKGKREGLDLSTSFTAYQGLPQDQLSASAMQTKSRLQEPEVMSRVTRSSTIDERTRQELAGMVSLLTQ